MNEPKSEQWLMLNAVECWLHYFPDHQWTEQYKEIRDALQHTVQNSNTTQVEEQRKEQTSSTQERTTTRKKPTAKV